MFARPSVLPAAIASLLALAGTSFANSSPSLVQTVEGPVKGVIDGEMRKYLGIPYAAPPVGENRWRPPAPVAHWDEPLDASKFGQICPQVTTLGVFALSSAASEDCLFLNVFTKNSATDTKKPVIVWIHGGGNISGASDDYDGTALAQGGLGGEETVVVTFNYRLNLFGTFSHPAIDREQHLWGNYGVLDQQAVLAWVKRNIQAFGGDPERVTVGGQSAGSYHAGAQVLSPLSKGLIHRAILQSSPGFTYLFPTAEQASRKGLAMAAAAGCEGDDVAVAKCLRSLSVSRLLQLAGNPASPSAYTVNMPIVDGQIIPSQPEEAWSSGSFNKVPIMGGATRDEYTFFNASSAYFTAWPMKAWTVDNYNTMLAPDAFCIWCKNASMPPEAKATYPLSDFAGDPAEAIQRLNTDVAKCRELHVMEKIADQVPTYAYDFTYDRAPFYFPKVNNLKVGASHTIDLQFLFPGFHGGPFGVNIDQDSGQPRELNHEENELSQRMIASWTQFAATGDPNIPGAQTWPRFTSKDGTYLVQDIPLATKSVKAFRQEYKCDFWDERLPF